MTRSKLALLGGDPVRGRPWPIYNMIGLEEKREVMEVLDSGVLSDFIANVGSRFYGGPKVKAFEEAWARAFDVPHAVSMNSCTSCLHAALVALGVGPGDEVIVPQLGMCAAATVVRIVGASPVFADCNRRTMLVDAESVARLITPRTKAAIAVHLAGHPAPMNEIMALSRRHDFAVVEDNAQAPGALYHGRYAGTIGHVGCFSLNCHKIIQSGEGGVACTNDEKLSLRLQLARNHGEKCLQGFGLESSGILGLNLRMTEMEAAVGIHQLAKLHRFNERTRELARYVTEHLDVPGLLAPPEAEGCTHVYYIYHWDYDAEEIGIPPEIFARALQAEGLPVHARYGYLISRLPPFEGRRDSKEGPACDERYPGACAAIERSLWTMMIRPHLDESDMDVLIEAVHKVYRCRDELMALKGSA